VAGQGIGVGVQWHPEEGDERRLITAFVEAAAQPRPAKPAEPQVPRKPVAVKPRAGSRR